MVQNTKTYFDKSMLRLRLFCKNVPSISPLAGLKPIFRARQAKYRTNLDDRKIEAMADIKPPLQHGTDTSHGNQAP